MKWTVANSNSDSYHSNGFLLRMENHRLEILNRIRLSSEEDSAESAGVNQKLKQEYNEMVDMIYKETHGVYPDILDAFPPEIWIHIIQQSLPSHDYAPALLLLTTVSTKWQQRIISTPGLWARIEIYGLDEDSLATIHTFVHLSLDVPLLLTLYAPVKHDSVTFHSILSSFGGRLQRVVITAGHRNPAGEELASYHQQIYFELDRLLRTPKYASNVLYIEVDYPHLDVIHGRTLDVVHLPRLLRALRGRCLCSLDLTVPHGSLEEIHTCVPLEALTQQLGHMSHLKTLTIAENNVTSDPGDEMITALPPFPKLTKFAFRRVDRLLSMTLLETMGPNLLDLELYICYPQFYDLIEILKISTRLRKLSVTLGDFGRDQDIDNRVSLMGSSSPSSAITTLRTLFLSLASIGHHEGYISVADKSGIRSQVIPSIASLYKDIEEVSFCLDYIADLLRPILGYLSQLPNLKRLHLDAPPWHYMPDPEPPQEVVLQTLEELKVASSPVLRFLRAPQLLSLRLPWDGMAEVCMLRYTSINNVRLTIPTLPYRAAFLPGSFSSLTNLTIHVTGHDSLKPGLFPSIKEISVICDPDTLVASSLCMSLLYHPEECPSLSNIRLFGCAPEWDILFNMLERRNFLPNSSVSRIQRLTLPYIPHFLRAPLTALLRGRYTSRPLDQDISFEATMGPILDNQISGCRTCIRGIMGPCNEPAIGMEVNRTDCEDFYRSIYSTGNDHPRLEISTLDDHPLLSVDPQLLSWIYRREVKLDVWLSTIQSLKSSGCWRRAICVKQRKSAPVEITEHDYHPDANMVKGR